MKRKDHRIDNTRIAIKGFMAFNKFGDAWVGSHNKDRLQNFIEQHPLLKLEPEIYIVSTKTTDIRIHRPHSLREKHVEMLAKISSPALQRRKKRNLLPVSALLNGSPLISEREDG